MVNYSPLHGDEAAIPLDPMVPNASPAGSQSAERTAPPRLQEKSKPSNVKGAARTLIILACLGVTVPIFGLVIALLVIIFTNRVSRSDNDSFLPASDVPKNESCPSPAFLVDFNATTLVIPGTWISTIANLVAGLLMFLLSFLLAKGIKTKSVQRVSELPTPKQLSLHVGLTGAGIGPLWDWLAYAIGWRKQRVRHMSKEVKVAAIALIILLALGILTQLADLWFHEATTTVLWTTIQLEQQPEGIGYSRQLSASCLANYSSPDGDFSSAPLRPLANDRLPCSVYVGDLQYYLPEPSEGYRLAAGSSRISNISIASHNSASLALLLPANPPVEADWRAETIGVSTQCKNILQDCRQSCSSAFLTNCDFTCTEAQGYQGNLTGELGQYRNGTSWNWTMIPNELPPDTASIISNAPNPYWHTTQAFAAGGLTGGLTNDSAIIHTSFYYVYTVLKCSTAVHNVTYRSVGGNITIENAVLSSTEVSQNVNGPMAFMHSRDQGTPGIGSIMRTEFASALFAANSAAELEQQFADAHSRVTLGFGASALTDAATLNYQIRNQQLLACVPQAPLWVLILIAMIIVLAALILTVLALVALDDDVADVQAKLSVAGLAATIFETIPGDGLVGSAKTSLPVEVDQLFAEYHGADFGKEGGAKRVGFERKRVGWLFSSFEG